MEHRAFILHVRAARRSFRLAPLFFRVSLRDTRLYRASSAFPETLTTPTTRASATTTLW
jgi:hypothetical protein